MKALNCVIIVLLIVLIWQCCCLGKEKFGGEAPKPYTPNLPGPAWLASAQLPVFEQANTPQRAGTLLQRLGMEGAGAPGETKDNFIGTFDRLPGQGIQPGMGTVWN